VLLVGVAEPLTNFGQRFALLTGPSHET